MYKIIFGGLLLLTALALLILFGDNGISIVNVHANENEKAVWQNKVEHDMLVTVTSTGNTDFRVRFSARPDLSDAEGLNWNSQGLYI